MDPCCSRLSHPALRSGRLIKHITYIRDLSAVSTPQILLHSPLDADSWTAIDAQVTKTPRCYDKTRLHASSEAVLQSPPAPNTHPTSTQRTWCATAGNHLHALGQAVLEALAQQLRVQLPADEDHAAGAGLALPPRPRRRPLEQAVHALQGLPPQLMSAPNIWPGYCQRDTVSPGTWPLSVESLPPPGTVPGCAADWDCTALCTRRGVWLAAVLQKAESVSRKQEACLEDEGVGEAGDGEDALHAEQVLPAHLYQAAQPVVHLHAGRRMEHTRPRGFVLST